MAYDNGLIDIVYLIDIFNGDTAPEIVSYLGKRYLKENKPRLEEAQFSQLSLYKRRMNIDYFQSQISTSFNYDSNEKIDSNEIKYDQSIEPSTNTKLDEKENHKLYDESDRLRPLSVLKSPRKASDSQYSSLSTRSSFATFSRSNSEKWANKNFLINKILQRVDKVDQRPKSLWTNIGSNSNAALKEKSISYDSYKVNFKIINPINSLIDRSSKNDGSLSRSSSKRLSAVNLANTKELKSESPLNFACFSSKLSLKPRAVTSRLKSSQLIKNEDLTSMLNKSNQINSPNKSNLENLHYNSSTSYKSKHLLIEPKLANYRQAKFTSTLSPFYDTQLLNLNFKEQKKLNLDKPTKNSFVSKPDKIKLQINSNYLNALKRSGLSNNNCIPILRDASSKL
jgi:hypothetical protein